MNGPQDIGLDDCRIKHGTAGGLLSGQILLCQGPDTLQEAVRPAHALDAPVSALVPGTNEQLHDPNTVGTVTLVN